MIITIDGPSGVGKGTVARMLASDLGYHLLDSGALYRLTALAAQRKQVDLTDEERLVDVANTMDIHFEANDQGICYFLEGENVSDAIRSEDIGMGASVVGASGRVREVLLDRQRGFAEPPGLVADGRDMGTTIFPSADLKIFLSATAEERAKRRLKQLKSAGEALDPDKVLQDIQARDKQDRERPVSPLRPAEDAVMIDTTHLSVNQVYDAVKALL